MRFSGPHPRLKWICATSLFSCISIYPAAAQKEPVQLDSSDWWSYTRQVELPYQKPKEPIQFQNREPAEDNFRVAGISLDTTPHDFSEIRSKFGDGTEVERGDAASGRNQICFVSATGSVYLIFEFGELNSVLYVFEQGQNWNGRELCARSKAVSTNSSTVSGLKLGMSPQQVRSILGNPNVARPDRLVYYFSYKKKTTPEDLARLRKGSPDMSDDEFRENFAYADGEAYVEARFGSGKLNYLAVSKSESY